MFLPSSEDPNNPITLVARLHNDDIHTYDDVIGALMRCGKNRVVANTLTTAVDHQGHAAIYVGPKAAEITRLVVCWLYVTVCWLFVTVC